MSDTEEDQVGIPESQSGEGLLEGDCSRWAEVEGPRFSDADIEDVTEAYPEKQDG